MTKFINMAIVLRSSWDSKFPLPASVKEELVFWKDNVRSLNGRHIGLHLPGSRTIVYSNASNLGTGGVIKGRDGVICHLPCSPDEIAWRKLKAVLVCLSSFCDILSGYSVQWYTDNRNIPYIVHNGSMKVDLHQLALSIFKIALRYSIDLQIDWIPRSLNQHGDSISRIVDFDDWGVSFEFFLHIDFIWGPHTVDRFADSNNHKLTRFYLRYWNPRSEGVDAFCYDWLVPPVFLVPRVIRHLTNCKASGTLIVPKWVSSPFWPMLFGTHSPFHACVKGSIIFTDVAGIFVKGSTESIFDGLNFKSHELAVRLSAHSFIYSSLYFRLFACVFRFSLCS